jgi:hypothetical protein
MQGHAAPVKILGGVQCVHSATEHAIQLHNDNRVNFLSAGLFEHFLNAGPPQVLCALPCVFYDSHKNKVFGQA